MTRNYLKLRALADASTISARIRELGTASATVKAFEVSPRSCLLECDLPEASEVWITLGALPPVRGTIIEAERGFAECEFYSPVDVIKLHSNRPLKASKQLFRAVSDR